MLWWRRFDLKCIVWKMDLQESGEKNCQVAGADHNLKLDPNGLFKVAVLVWIFRDLWTALECKQRQRQCRSARFRRTPARTQTQQSMRKCNQKQHHCTFSDDWGRRELHLIMLHWVLHPDEGPEEVRHLPRFSPCGRVIILIYLLPALQLLCSSVSDHLCGFIISAGAR